MDKLKIFLLADGVIIVAGFIFFLILYLRRGQESHFREDLWKEQKKKQAAAQKRAAEDQVDKKILLEHRPDPRDQEEKTAPMGTRPVEFRVPNFYGKPHEVLGVPANPDRDLVVRAYKHWIKRYHPDRVTHLGAKYVEQARRRAEQLNSARDALLKSMP